MRLWWLFWSTCLAITITLAPRVWALRYLYGDPVIRSAVHDSLRIVADQEGWFVSDISLKRIDSSGMQIMHREHRKGRDPKDCYRVQFHDHALLPCDAV